MGGGGGYWRDVFIVILWLCRDVSVVCLDFVVNCEYLLYWVLEKFVFIVVMGNGKFVVEIYGGWCVEEFLGRFLGV